MEVARRVQFVSLQFGMIALLLNACASIDRSSVNLASLENAVARANRDHQVLIRQVVDQLVNRAILRGDGALDILLLSGGGQNGAYGMGFLRGWKERAQAPMPKMDLVTGVSTGALQATFALLGTREDLKLGAALYRNAASQFAPTFDLLFWARSDGGIVNISRYKYMIAEVFNADVQARLNSELGQGRQLLISTTDFDLGVGKIWNLSREMGSEPQSLSRAHQLLLAATSIPGVFPYQIVDGHVHLDGGVVANTLPVLDLDGYRMLAVKLKERGVRTPVKVRLWVLINLWTHPRLAAVDPSDRNAVQMRSGDLLFSLAQPQMLARLRELSEAVDYGVPGLKVEVRVSSVPNSWANEEGALDLMNLEWMQKLERRGYERAQGAAPWEKIISPYERPVTSK